MDFVTIIYKDEIELGLIKLQAISMKYVDYDLINNIYIIYNDIGEYDIKDLIIFYPENVRKKVHLFYNKDIDKSFTNEAQSNWRNQQILKLLVANIVETKYFLILDGKNHFIRNITHSDFFENDKPILFTNKRDVLIETYYNCLDYYGISCPFDYINNPHIITLNSMTPYLLCKTDVLEMITYITEKENDSFYNFFIKSKLLYTEFYLYSTYLIFTNKIQNYLLNEINFYTIFDSKPIVNNNKIKNTLDYVKNNNNIKIFGLHRGVIKKMNFDLKQKTLLFYNNYYDINECYLINKYILKCIPPKYIKT